MSKNPPTSLLTTDDEHGEPVAKGKKQEVMIVCILATQLIALAIGCQFMQDLDHYDYFADEVGGAVVPGAVGLFIWGIY